MGDDNRKRGSDEISKYLRSLRNKRYYKKRKDEVNNNPDEKLKHNEKLKLRRDKWKSMRVYVNYLKRKEYLDEDERVIVDTFDRAVRLKQFSDRVRRLIGKTSEVHINIAHNDENEGEINDNSGDQNNNIQIHANQPNSVQSNLQDQQNVLINQQIINTNQNYDQSTNHHSSTLNNNLNTINTNTELEHGSDTDSSSSDSTDDDEIQHIRIIPNVNVGSNSSDDNNPVHDTSNQSSSSSSSNLLSTNSSGSSSSSSTNVFSSSNSDSSRSSSSNVFATSSSDSSSSSSSNVFASSSSNSSSSSSSNVFASSSSNSSSSSSSDENEVILIDHVNENNNINDNSHEIERVVNDNDNNGLGVARLNNVENHSDSDNNVDQNQNNENTLQPVTMMIRDSVVERFPNYEDIIEFWNIMTPALNDPDQSLVQLFNEMDEDEQANYIDYMLDRAEYNEQNIFNISRIQEIQTRNHLERSVMNKFERFEWKSRSNEPAMRSFQCPICQDDADVFDNDNERIITVTTCASKHMFCDQCVEQMSEFTSKCPLCRQTFS